MTPKTLAPAAPQLSAQKFWTVWLLGLLVWFSALGLASSPDLAISMAVTNREHWFARAVALAGEWPPWVVLLLCLGALASGQNSRFRSLRPLALAVVILALLEPLIITQSLKFFWGRVRFRNLAADFSNFTPFFLPAGIGTGQSFPSGHVAMAFVPVPLAFYLSAVGSRTAAYAWALTLAYGLAVAWGRILAGAHYLTDCVFSAGLSLLLAAVLVRYFMRTNPPAGDAGQVH